jgi:glyoxylate reductase
MKPRVYITRRIAQEALDMIAEAADMEVWEEEMPPPRKVILSKVGDVDGLLPLLTDRIDGPVMDAAPRLRVISNYAVGCDNIDVPAATERGIAVGNTPGVLTDTTADLAFALLMATARRIPEGSRYVREGRWRTWGPQLLLGQDVHHATLGLVGLGRIGSGMARRARGFEMRVLYYDVRRRQDLEEELGITCVDLDTLLAESDFISLHTPLTPDTLHLIGSRELGLMKETAILINSSRGPIVEPKALYQALSAGRIAGAGLDVTDPEPIAPDDPLVSQENAIIVPHIGSASVATRTKMAVMAAQNLIAGLRGKPLPNPVNPEVGSS